MNAAERIDWLNWRRQGIGASDVPGILGMSPYENQTPLSIYLDKIGERPDVKQNAAMKLGLLMEPVILNLYREESGEVIVGEQVRTEHREHKFIRATLDGLTSTGKVVQAKNVDWRKREEWGEPGTDEVPDYVACQNHAEMLAYDAHECDVPILIGGNEFRIYHLDRDSEMDRFLIEKMTEFHRRVELRDPPLASLPADYETIRRLKPKYQSTIDLPDECLTLVDMLEEAKGLIKANTQASEEFKAKLIDAMAGHACALLPDGRRITRKTINRKGFTVEPTSYIDFRISK